MTAEQRAWTVKALRKIADFIEAEGGGQRQPAPAQRQAPARQRQAPPPRREPEAPPSGQYPAASFKNIGDAENKIWGLRLDNSELQLAPGYTVEVTRADKSKNLYILGALVSESEGGKYGGEIYEIDRKVRKGETPPEPPEGTYEQGPAAVPDDGHLPLDEDGERVPF